jgi:Tfp pilus assembly protein PilV
MKAIHQTPRGVTIMEVLVSSVILIIGLIGVIQLLIAGSVNERRGEDSVSAAFLAAGALDGARSIPFDSLTAGTYVTPVTDEKGRLYDQTVVVTAANTDAGYPRYEIAVTISHTDRLTNSAGDAVTTVLRTFVSHPDAGQ